MLKTCNTYAKRKTNSHMHADIKDKTVVKRKHQQGQKNESTVWCKIERSYICIHRANRKLVICTPEAYLYLVDRVFNRRLSSLSIQFGFDVPLKSISFP